MATRKSQKGIVQEQGGINDLLSQVYEQEFIVEEKPEGY